MVSLTWRLKLVSGVCRQFGTKITSWCTFNEPGVFCFSGYCAQSFPPARLLAFSAAGRALRNMLVAHVCAYELIKSIPGLPGHLGGFVYAGQCDQL